MMQILKGDGKGYSWMKPQQVPWTVERTGPIGSVIMGCGWLWFLSQHIDIHTHAWSHTHGWIITLTRAREWVICAPLKPFSALCFLLPLCMVDLDSGVQEHQNHNVSWVNCDWLTDQQIIRNSYLWYKVICQSVSRRPSVSRQMPSLLREARPSTDLWNSSLLLKITPLSVDDTLATTANHVQSAEQIFSR